MKTDQSVLALDAPRAVNPWLSLAVILMAPFMTVVDVFIIIITLPTMQAYFHTTNAAVQLIAASYLIGYSVLLVTGSRLGDHFGRRKLFIIGMFAFTITSVMCGCAQSIEQLIFFRFLQGVSAAFGVPQTMTLVQLAFHNQEDKAKAYGYYGITVGLASIVGQFLGGYLVTTHWITDSWRLIFLINLPFGLLTVIMARFFVEESRQQTRRRLDYPGVILLTLALSALVFPIIQGRESGWPLWSLVMLGTAPLLLLGFYLYQRKLSRADADPLLHVDLFRNRSFNLGIVCVMLYFGVYSAFMMVVAIFLQAGLQMAPMAASQYFSVLGVSFMIAAYLSIKNGARYGIPVLQVGGLLLLVCFGIIFFTFHEGAVQPFWIMAGLLTYGAGAGLVVPSILNISLRKVPVHHAGVASGVYATTQQFASALGVSVLAGIFFSALGHFHAYHIALKTTMVAMSGYMVIMLLVLQRMKKE